VHQRPDRQLDRFGRPAERRAYSQRHMFSFSPGSVFALIRCGVERLILTPIDILRVVGAVRACSTVPHVPPRDESSLYLSGRPKVEKVLQAIDAVEARHRSGGRRVRSLATRPHRPVRCPPIKNLQLPSGQGASAKADAMTTRIATLARWPPGRGASMRRPIQFVAPRQDCHDSARRFY
jgi:hypothetical protein